MATEQKATDADALGWWCDACRQVGLIHCSEVENCVATGQMVQLPYSERAKRHAAYRKDLIP